MPIHINQAELLECLEMELAINCEDITCLCPDCGNEIVADLDAKSAYCEGCLKWVNLINPYRLFRSRQNLP